MAFGMGFLFEEDNMSFGHINLAQTFINMALLANNLALEQKKACQV